MGERQESWALHYDIEQQVPDAPDRIGYAQLQDRVAVGQRGRVKRAVSTLVGLDVLAWAGQRRGRAVTQGPRTLDSVLAEGLLPMPEREIQTYPLLVAPLDAYITAWHRERGDPIDASGTDGAVGDGVTTYVTAAARAARPGEPSTHTRPDLTVVVDLHYAHAGDWNDVHAVEVKPYWAVTRAALFETAAQAALGRCTFSWLLVWIPDATSGHFTQPQIDLIAAANAELAGLSAEAHALSLGLLVARELGEDAELTRHAEPSRRVMDPRRADELFAQLQRTDGTR